MPSTNNYRVNQVEIPRLNGNQNIGGLHFKPEDNGALMDMIFQYLDDHSPILSPTDDLPFKQKLPGVMQWREQVPAGYEPSPIDFREMKTDYENSLLESAPSPTGSVFSDVSSYDDESVESDVPATPPINPAVCDTKISKPSNYNLNIPDRPFSFVWNSNSPAAPPEASKKSSSRSECTLQRSAQYDERFGPNLPARPILSNFNTSKSEHYVEPVKTQQATCPSPPQMFGTITNVADIMPVEFLPSCISSPEERQKSIGKDLRIVTQKLTLASLPSTPAIRSGFSRGSEMSPRQPHVGLYISPKSSLSQSPSMRKYTPAVSIPARNPLRNLREIEISSSKYSTPAVSARTEKRSDFDEVVSPCSTYRRPFESPLSRNVNAIISPKQLDSNGVSPLSSVRSPNTSLIIQFKQKPNEVMSPSLMSPLRQVQIKDNQTPTSSRSVHFAKVDYSVTIPARGRMRSLVQETLTPRTPPPIQEKKFGSTEWLMALHAPSDSEHSSDNESEPEVEIQPSSAKSNRSDKTDLYGASPIVKPPKQGKMETFSSAVEKSEKPSATLTKIDFTSIDFGGALDLNFPQGNFDLTFDDKELTPIETKLSLSPIPSPILEEFGIKKEFDYEATVKKSAQILAESTRELSKAPMSPLHPVLRKMNVGKWFTRGYFAGENGMHLKMTRNVVSMAKMEWAIEDTHGNPVLKCVSQTNSLARRRDFWDIDGNRIFTFQKKMGTTRVAESTRGYELFSVKQASLYSMPHWTIELSGGHNKNSAQWLAKGDDELENVVVNWGGFEVGRISVVPGNMRHTYNVTTAREMNYCIMAAICTVFDDLRTDEGSWF